jgi:CheY-like chemotaxis protein
MSVLSRFATASSLPNTPYVLLVDDEEASSRPLAELLRLAGFSSLTASSAAEALVCCSRRRPNVVVTDLVMPGPDGRELARRLRRRFPGVPILLVTGENLDSSAWTVPGDLFESIFSKPLDFERFISLLGTLMPPTRSIDRSQGRA